jgi:hypothetical protein
MSKKQLFLRHLTKIKKDWQIKKRSWFYRDARSNRLEEDDA